MVPPFRNRESLTTRSRFRGFAFRAYPKKATRAACFSPRGATRTRYSNKLLAELPTLTMSRISRGGTVKRIRRRRRSLAVGCAAESNYCQGSLRWDRSLAVRPPLDTGAPERCHPSPTALPGCAVLPARACNRCAVRTSRFSPSRISRRPVPGYPSRREMLIGCVTSSADAGSPRAGHCSTLAGH